MEPYKIESPHRGISRVLQGFEVVLLSVLACECLKIGLLPISLDHDGLLVIPAFRKTYAGGTNIYDELSQFQNLPLEDRAFQISHYICEKLNQSSFKDWSTYLLANPVPLEPKRFIADGRNFEF
jgi:hypothetical protein